MEKAYAQDRQKYVFGLASVTYLLLGCSACVTTAEKEPAASHFSGKAKGFLYQIGEIKTGSFETAEYLDLGILSSTLKKGKGTGRASAFAKAMARQGTTTPRRPLDRRNDLIPCPGRFGKRDHGVLPHRW